MMKITVPNTSNNQMVCKTKSHKHIKLYGQKLQQAGAVLTVPSETDMASKMLCKSLTSKPEKDISNNARGRSVWNIPAMSKRLYTTIIADQVFSYFVKTCIIIIIIIIIIIKGEQAVKWRMQNNQSDYKNTDERIFRRIWGRSEVENGCV
jgi:hypothetical protein